MSLEQTLEKTNSLLQQVITILQSGVSAPVAFGEPEVRTVAAMTASVVTDAPKRGRPRKEAAATDTPAEAPSETTYWLIEKHRTVYAQEAGMTAPSISGAVTVSKEVYEAKKLEFSAPVSQVQASPAPTAPISHTAQAAGSTQDDVPEPKPERVSTTTQPAAAPSAVEFKTVVDAFVELNRKPGAGREAVVEILKKYLPGDDKPVVPKLAGLTERHAEILADIQSRLNPEAEYDPLG
jgi:hypothetical protein